MLAVYELVRFLLANKWQTMRCDWLAVYYTSWRQNVRMHLVLTTLIKHPHFTFVLYTTAPKQILGAYVFAYEQLNKSLCIIYPFGYNILIKLHFNFTSITDAATSSSAESRHLRHTVVQQNVVVCDTNVGQQLFANKCCPTIVGQHLLVVCLRL